MSRQAFVFSGPAAMMSTPRLGSTPSRPWASARFTASRMAASGRPSISTSPGMETNCPLLSRPSRSTAISRI